MRQWEKRCFSRTFLVHGLLQNKINPDVRIWHLDISNAFVYGSLQPDEFVQMKPPAGFEELPGKVLLIVKSLYGLKCAPRVWRELLFSTLALLGFSVSFVCASLLFRDSRFSIFIYVDDIFVVSTEKEKDELVAELNLHFDTKDLGILRRVLGIEIMYNKNSMLIHQKDYLTKLGQTYLKDASRTPQKVPLVRRPQLSELLLEPNEQRLYQEITGSLLFAACCTRPDIAAACSMLCAFMSKSCKSCMEDLLGLLSCVRNARYWFAFGD